MRRILLVVCLLALPLAGLAQEVRQPRQKIELGDVTLADGRVLRNAKLLSATSSGLNIAHAAGIEQIARKSFSPEFLAEHAAAIAAGSNEYKAEETLRRRHQQAKAAEETNRKIRQRQALAAGKQQEAQAQKDYQKLIAEVEREQARKAETEARIAAHKAAELARSHDGLIFDRFDRGFDGSTLVVRNVHDNPRRLDWRDLRARKADGRIVIPVNCESTDERDRSLDLRSGQTRTFVLRWMGGNDDVEAIIWADGSHEIARWTPPQNEEVTPPEGDFAH